MNTGSFFQSSTGQDPSLTQPFNGFLEAGSTVVSGVANNYSDIGTLSMALSGGATITLPTNALLQPVASGVSITLDDRAGHTQSWTTAAAAAAGATSITVVSQAPTTPTFPATTTTIYLSPPKPESNFQSSSAVYNTGKRSTVAVAGFAVGTNVWAANFVTNVQAGGGYVSPAGKGVEVDFGIVASNIGTCVGLHLAATGASGNAAQFVNMDAEGFGVPGPAYGITIGVLLPITITTTGSPQTPDMSPHELVASAAIPLTPGWSTTVASGSGGVDVATFTGSQSLSVASTSGASSMGGYVTVLTSSAGGATLSYTGIGSGSLTGVTLVSGSGTLSTGGVVNGGGWAGYPGIPTLDYDHPGMFAYGGNYYEFTALSTTNVTNDTLIGVSLFAGDSISVPASASVVIGTQPFGAAQGAPNLTSSFLRVVNAATMATGLDLSNGIFTNEAIAVPVNSQTAGDGLVVLATGGGLSTGSGVFFSFDHLSTATYGLRFHAASGEQFVDRTGYLFYADGGTYAKGIALAAASFTDSAIDLGNNSIRIGTGTGAMIGLAPAEKIGFWGNTPIIRPSAAGTNVGYDAGTHGTTFHSDDTYSGDVGSTKYTINGIVAALKNMGLLTQ